MFAAVEQQELFAFPQVPEKLAAHIRAGLKRELEGFRQGRQDLIGSLQSPQRDKAQPVKEAR